MLIEFSVENFRSFRDKATFSMVASSDDSLPQNVIHSAQGTDLNLLKSAVIYGANASGKSNFVKALSLMRNFIVHSSSISHEGVLIGVTPFKLDFSCSSKPSEFEIVFLWEGVRYAYGFKVDNRYVHEEWLYSYPKGQQRVLFERTAKPDGAGAVYKFGSYFEGEKSRLETLTKHNSLFISVASQFNNKIAEIVVRWFGENMRYILKTPGAFVEKVITAGRILNDLEFKSKVIDFLMTVADIDIEDFDIKVLKRYRLGLQAMQARIKDVPEKDVPDNSRKMINEDYAISVIHSGRDADGNLTKVPMGFGSESDGTKKIFALAAPWFSALEGGLVLLADELDVRLHPLLSERLIQMFNDEDANKGGQLIFTTHNTDLLEKNLFRRDQIWFTEKSHETGSTSLYSLWDFKTKKARKEENFRKNYLAGRYGAIPILERFEK